MHYFFKNVMHMKANNNIVVMFLLATFAVSDLQAQELVTDFDGNRYNTVKLGKQLWMAENLKSTHDALGEEIKRVCYQQLETNCDTFGGLYSWNELKVRQGLDKCQSICPDGWHLPSDKEWSEMIDALGGADSAALIMRSYPEINIQYAGNYHSRLNNYNFKGDIAYFWTATSFSHTAAWIRMIGRRNLNTNRSTVPKVYCLSVRCIRD